MNRHDTLIIPKKPTYLPLALGLLVGGGSLTYALTWWSHQDHAAGHTAASAPRRPAEAIDDDVAGSAVVKRADEGRTPEQKPGRTPEQTPGQTPGQTPDETPPADPHLARVSNGAEGGHEGGGAAPGGERKTVIIKMDPLLANLDEGDQLRYVRLVLSLEIAGEAQQKAQAALPRARHEALMYLSGLHMSDVQGLLGKQRIHRELQRRIADALGGALKRVYFDEFVVQ